MKRGLYPRLAADAMRKNGRLYLPYVLTCVGMVTMHYIITYMYSSKAVISMVGGGSLSAILMMGSWIIALFACIFLFYTNSFLMRRRKKELGLYNVLGMSKKNISRVLIWETVITALISIGLGLAVGVFFSKLSELGLVNLTRSDVSYDFSVSTRALCKTAEVFGVIFLLLLLNSLRQVYRQKAVNLLNSEAAAERPPKGSLFIGGAGAALLAAAYYIAVTIEQPLSAISMFFVAVAMVIVGTYTLMLSGSVTLCRLLKKNKKYYYDPRHFVTVSSMAYRMKRNGAGLASICILATMVLVMISSTASLYFGIEDALKNRFPKELNLTFTAEDMDAISDENVSAIEGDIREAVTEADCPLDAPCAYRSASTSGLLEGTQVEIDHTKSDAGLVQIMAGLHEFYFIPLSDYNRAEGKAETLDEGEALIYCYRTEYDGDVISFNGGRSFKIKKVLDDFIDDGNAAMMVSSAIFIVVPDMKSALEGLDAMIDDSIGPLVHYRYVFGFDTGKGFEEKAYQTLSMNVDISRYDGITGIRNESRLLERKDFYGIYGGMLYLGIILSIVFILAAVLMIYYKQVSEGYEDSGRFDIMKKVGMTGREIKKTINSQLLTVFFLPLALAACHLIFAFPIVEKLLFLFNLNNVGLFAAMTAACLAVFALFYWLVYRMTAGAYYKIVSGRE